MKLLHRRKLTDTVLQGQVSPPVLLVSPSLSFHQWSIILIFILPLSEGQAGVTWGPYNKLWSFKLRKHWKAKKPFWGFRAL